MYQEIILVVVVLALFFEFFDVSLGMGYGTITPVLILMGFDTQEVVLSVLFSSAFLGVMSAVYHHFSRNVDFRFHSKDFKVAGMLTVFGVVGIGLGAFLSGVVSEEVLDIYIGVLLVALGLLIFFRKKVKLPFSWKRLFFLGVVASFNKGMTGGGYGPVVASGQILSGVKSKNAVAITSLNEGLISITGIALYILFNGVELINWSIILSLIIGGGFVVPLGVTFVKKIKAKNLKLYVGLASVLLGVSILVKVFI